MPVKRPFLPRMLFSNRFGFRHTLLSCLTVCLVGLGLAYPFSNALQSANSRSFWSSFLPAVAARPLQGACTVNCTASAPATGQIAQQTAFTATATPAGCVGDPTFQWDFGDSTGSVQQNPTHAYTTGGIYTWRLTVESLAPGATANISTVVGGGGEGDAALDVSFARLLAVTRDPAGRGIYIVDAPHSNDAGGRTRIVFLNTGSAAVTIATRSIAPGTVRTVAGGGTPTGEDLFGVAQDIGSVTGLATNPTGDLLYFTDQTGARIRVMNVSAAPVSVRGTPLDPGKIRTFAKPLNMEVPVLGDLLFGLAYHPTTNDLIVADATPGVAKVYKIHQDGTAEVVAGNGEATRTDAVFEGGVGTAVPLLDPRAVDVDSTGQILISDSGHSRIIRVASNGVTTLLRQLTQGRGGESSYPIGLTVIGTSAYSANGNDQEIVRISPGLVTMAGQLRETCTYQGTNCGDGGSAAASTLLLPVLGGEVPLAGIDGEASGLYVLDQAANQRGRVRFINTTGAPVTRAGVTIAAGGIATIAG
ncbi:MAG: PKD domain-containing protein, partial [Acidobacteriota bacterium]